MRALIWSERSYSCAALSVRNSLPDKVRSPNTHVSFTFQTAPKLHLFKQSVRMCVCVCIHATACMCVCCVHACVHVCVRVCISVHVCVCVCVHVCMSMHVCVCACVHEHACVCVYTCSRLFKLSACVCVCVCVHSCNCMHVCVLRVCVHACVCACVHERTCVCVHAHVFVLTVFRFFCFVTGHALQFGERAHKRVHFGYSPGARALSPESQIKHH